MQQFFIGSDESLKGDTFGGLVVAAVLANAQERKKLSAIGVMDSKKVPTTKISLLAQQIRAICKYTTVKEILPAEYNVYKLTDILNQLHHECAASLKREHMADNELTNSSDDVEADNYASYTHYVDEFPGCKVGDVRKPKAESLYVEVAAASILAREAALAQIAALSKQVGFEIPLGSTHVLHALMLLKASRKTPEKFVKMHFKNVQAALGSAYLRDQSNE